MWTQSHFCKAGMLTVTLGLLLSSPGCSNPVKPIVPSIDAAIASINHAIDTLETQSDNWRNTLENLSTELQTQGIHNAVGDVDRLISRATVRTGVEFRCDLDFVIKRLIVGLKRIKQSILKTSLDLPPEAPTICHVDPTEIDLAMPLNQRHSLQFAGYDFDLSDNRGRPLRALIQNEDATMTDITSNLTLSTHYSATLDLSRANANLGPQSARIKLLWGDETLASVAVLNPLPTSQKRFRIEPKQFTPPHTRGDAEFKGNGPKVEIRVALKNEGRKIKLTLDMKAQETGGDNTTAEGNTEWTVYEAPPGFTITRIISPVEDQHSYIDDDRANDFFSFASADRMIGMLLYTGDTRGADAGTRTAVTIYFHLVTVELEQIR